MMRLLGAALATLFVVLVIGFSMAVDQQQVGPIDKADCLRKAIRPYQRAQCERTGQ